MTRFVSSLSRNLGGILTDIYDDYSNLSSQNKFDVKPIDIAIGKLFNPIASGNMHVINKKFFMQHTIIGFNSNFFFGMIQEVRRSKDLFYQSYSTTHSRSSGVLHSVDRSRLELEPPI